VFSAILTPASSGVGVATREFVRERSEGEAGGGPMRMFDRSFRYALYAAMAIAAAAVPASAQTPILPVLDHIHLNVPDQAKAVEWYQKYFGGTSMTEAPDRLMLGETRLIFLRNDKAQPSTGSALDHLGFSFTDLDAKMKELVAAGIKVVTPVGDVPGLFKLGFVEDPWGTRIEVVQDSEKLGLHHVHLRAPDPAATLAWYKDKFAGESGKMKDRIDGLKWSGVWLLVQRGDATPSEGHAIDHIGWRTPNLAAKTAELKARTVTFTTEPRPLKLASGTVVNFAYLEGPSGAKIELVQR
jgi:lactoylglutathione lyase